jgi:general secretion pathway protein C
MLHKRLPLLIALVIILASIGLSAFQLYPLYLEYSGATATSKNLGQSISTTDSLPLANAQQNKPTNRNIADYSMFGRFNASQAIEQDVQELPKTKLRLTLTGVSASENQKHATALIEGPDRSTESYRVGDTLPGNALLHSVRKDRVILSRSGKLETLFFTEGDSSTRLLSSVTNPSTASTAPSANTNYQTLGQNQAPRISIPENAPKISSEQKQSIRDKLSALRSRLRKQ